MSWPRIGACIVLGSATLLACTFTRSLDYLQEGDKNGTSSGASGTSTSSSGTTTSSTSSSGGEAGVQGVDLASTQAYPSNLVQDTEFLYWTTSANQVMRVAKAGGEVKELGKIESAGVGAVLDLAVDPSAGGSAYVLVEGSIKSLPREGGPVADFLATSTALSIVADDTYLFAVNESNGGNATLVRYPKANSAQPTVIGPPTGQKATTAGAPILFGDQIYWTFINDDATQVPICHQLPKTATAAFAAPVVWSNLAKGTDQPNVGVSTTSHFQLAADSDGLYWVDDIEVVPYRLKRDAPQSAAPGLLAADSNATAITVDASSMYVLAFGKIVKIAKADTSQKDVYPVDETATELVGDEKNLYYIVPGDDVAATGKIRRLAK